MDGSGKEEQELACHSWMSSEITPRSTKNSCSEFGTLSNNWEKGNAVPVHEKDDK